LLLRRFFLLYIGVSEDAELLPVIEAARSEWQKEGGRPWSEAERDLEETIESTEGVTGAKRV